MNTKEINSLLLIQLAGLGDMVMATPAIEALRRLYPQAKICLLTNPRSVDIIRGSSYIDEIFVIEGFRDIFARIKRLRDYHFDMVINLYRLYTFNGAIKMLLLFWAIGGKCWVGRDTDGRGFFYHKRVPEESSGRKHEIEYKLDIIRALGGQIRDINLSVQYDRNDEDFVNVFLNKRGISESDILVGINCSTFRPSRNWIFERYAKLADYLIERLKVKVVFLGVAKDKNVLLEIKKSMRQEPLDFVGAFNIRQLASFLKRCRVVISPDSGSVHIASALGVPVVALFGPGEYERFRPYSSEGRVIVIRKEVECSPCFKRICRNKRCMELITVQDVLQAAEKLIEKFLK